MIDIQLVKGLSCVKIVQERVFISQIYVPIPANSAHMNAFKPVKGISHLLLVNGVALILSLIDSSVLVVVANSYFLRKVSFIDTK